MSSSSSTTAAAGSSSNSSSSAAAPSGPPKKTPSDFLRSLIGRPVIVRLSSGVDYKGILVCLDGFMNVALEQTEEWVEGQLKSKYGDAFLRGNNGECDGRASGEEILSLAARFICLFVALSPSFAVLYITAQPKKR